jgi:tetratricopeptide (TPR) repeat protein
MKKILLFIGILLSNSELFSQELSGEELGLLGITLYQKGELQESVSTFSQAIEKLNPKLKPTALMVCYSYMGQAKAQLGDNRGAVADLTKSISYANEITIGDSIKGGKGQLATNYRLRGQLKGLLKFSFNEVIVDLNKAVSLDPKNGRNYVARGYAKYQNGEKNQGCLDLSKAGELGFSQAYEYIKELCN